MMHIMNGQLMAVFIDDNKDSVNNQPGLIGFEIEASRARYLYAISGSGGLTSY
jgi:hypothetical protein